MPSSTCDKEEIVGVSDQTPSSLPMVGICSLNRMEWIIADFACLISGYTTVPVHVPLDSAQKEFILCTTESSVLIVGGPKSLEEMVHITGFLFLGASIVFPCFKHRSPRIMVVTGKRITRLHVNKPT